MRSGTFLWYVVLHPQGSNFRILHDDDSMVRYILKLNAKDISVVNMFF